MPTLRLHAYDDRVPGGKRRGKGCEGRIRRLYAKGIGSRYPFAVGWFCDHCGKAAIDQEAVDKFKRAAFEESVTLAMLPTLWNDEHLEAAYIEPFAPEA